MDDADVLKLADEMATAGRRSGMTDEELEEHYRKMPHIPGDPPLDRYWLRLRLGEKVGGKPQ